MEQYPLYKKNYKIYISLFIPLILIIIIQASCKKFIEVPPPSTGLNAGNVYTTDATAAAVLTDIYAEMSEQNIMLSGENITSITLFSALGADELTLYDINRSDLLDYYRNQLTITTLPSHWNAIYIVLFSANNAIEGLNKSTNLSLAVKQQLLGEAKFIRAFCYFYLVNLYGDVPLVLNLDYKTNAILSRTPISLVYQQIITDLKEAQNLLSNDYLKGDAFAPYPAGMEERIRPTKWAATALLARTYLYNRDFANAEAEATNVINQTSHFGLTSLNETFLKNNKEAIWQLQPVGGAENSNTGEGKLFVLPAEGPNASNNPVYLSNEVVQSFEIGDQRKTTWADSVVADNSSTYYYAYKYKIGNVLAPTEEYPTILRLAEQYLIRSEARAEQNKLNEAKNDLNTIRTRAGLNNTTATDKASLLKAIINERRVELFTEWGHRWFDLKRTNQIDAVMNNIAPIKGGFWSPSKALYPIPKTDMDKDPNLVQNPGYN